MAKMSGILAIAMALCPGFPATAWAQQTDQWTALERFLGDWRGTATGQAGTGYVTRRYANAMGGRFIQETNTSTYPPQGKNKDGEVHEHLGMFSYDKQRNVLMLRQFHIEGFVNTYKQAAEAGAGKLVFESEGFENFSNSWKARETYEFDADDRLVEIFELAPPGKDFQVYSRTELRRAK